MRSSHAQTRPIQFRKEIQTERLNFEELSSLSLYPPAHQPLSLSAKNGVLFRQALPVLIALQSGKLTNPDPSVVNTLVDHGCLVKFSESEVAELRRKAAHLPQREIAERRERRNLLQLEREYFFWDKLASIPRFLSNSATPSGFEEKLEPVRRDLAEAKENHEALLANLVESQAAKLTVPRLIPCESSYLAFTRLGELLLNGEILHQLEEVNLTVQSSVYRLQSLIEKCNALHERYREVGSALSSKSEYKRVLHLGDIQLGLTAAHGSVQDVVERFTETFIRLKRDFEGTDRSIALVSLAVSSKPGDNDEKLVLLKNCAAALFPDRYWPLSSFFLAQAAQCILQRVSQESLVAQYKNISTAISYSKWGTRHHWAGQFASLLAASIEGDPELIVNQLSDLAESLEDMSGFRSDFGVEVASLLVLLEEGSIYRIMQRTAEARALLGTPPHHNHGITLVNSVLLAMLPGSIPENFIHLENLPKGDFSTSIFRPDCFLLAAAYAELEKVGPELLPSIGTRAQTSPNVIQVMCRSILSADLVG